MHELRKAHKGMRRLQRRLMIAEGLLGKIYTISRSNLYHPSWKNINRLQEIHKLASYAFYDVWKVDRVSKKLDEHIEYLRSLH